ncbi:metal ABC transporter solute-binding protein, Zn/Mn family, partial [Nocardia brasiliensis]|uniref:metal ABC transporter solute-binding protein, Zn/Mn family n=1 Tax=Nocardia brasiliensis TaxID=37326 RepID=UPI0024567B0B
MTLPLVAACTGGGGDRTGIVVTTNILGDLTRAVAGDAPQVTVVLPPHDPPHTLAVEGPPGAKLEMAAFVVAHRLGLDE